MTGAEQDGFGSSGPKKRQNNWVGNQHGLHLVDIRELGSLCGGIFGKVLYGLDKDRKRIRERWQEAHLWAGGSWL